MAETKTIAYLTPFPATALQDRVVEADAKLYDLETVLSVAADLAEKAANPHRNYSPDTYQIMAKKVSRLLWVALGLQEKIKEAVLSSSEELEEHIEYRAAA